MSVEFVEHTGDVAVELGGADEAELLGEAARALLEILVDPEAGPVRESETRSVQLEAEDAETLLVDFLNELVFLFDSRGFLCRRLEVDTVDLSPPTRLEGTLHGETYTPSRHVARTEVKAATFHDLAIRREAGGFHTRVVFDL